jgi:hypothetical protein
MKKSILMLLFICIPLFLVPSALAQGPEGEWISTISCQNLDRSNAAEITLTFYAEGEESATLSYNDTIAANSSRNYITSDALMGVPADFSGSVVISSLKPVVCSVNTQNTGTGTSENPYRIASSSGVDELEVASTMYAPQVMNDYAQWNSYISVQNASESSVTVEVTYKNRIGEDVPAATETATIPGYSNKLFFQSDNAGLPNEFLGAAKVTVTSPAEAKIGAVVNFYNNGFDSGTSQFHSYNGVSSGSNKLYLPRVVRRFYGYNSGITIQNVGTIDTTVTITFNFAGETFTYNSPNISPSTALVLYLPNVSEIDAVDALTINQRFGNAVATTDNPEAEIVGIVNEDNRGDPDDNDSNPIPAERIGQGSTYSAIPAGTETKNIFFPQVMRNVDGVFSGGFYFSNVSGEEGFCEIHFSGVPEAKMDDFPLVAGESKSFYAPDIPNLPDGFNSSIHVVCTVEIIGIQNFAAAPDSEKLGDSFTQNNGFNR